MINKIGFGGGCHWCTEAVFQSLKGVSSVEQGYISSIEDNSNLSEAVIVHFNPKVIPLHILVEVHLLTHNSTSNHSRRNTYRSAIYYFEVAHKNQIEEILVEKRRLFDKSIITKILRFNTFKSSREAILNYYSKNPKLPFCKTYIHPKLKFLKSKYSKYTTS